MIQKIQIKVLPAEAADINQLIPVIAAYTAIPIEQINGYRILKKSMDARSKTVWIHLTMDIYLQENPPVLGNTNFSFNPVKKEAKKVLIIGTGPAGLFAALQLIQCGIQPILLERGKDSRSRRRDLAVLNKEGILNPESNYCFGEGGAGTYSDGKLYTRSNKRGNIQRILDLFVHFGAEDKIHYEAHPHIGTNKLPQIITAMRQCIEDCGGMVLFEKKLVNFTIENNRIKNIQTADGTTISADAYILATGHSARDIFTLLQHKNITLLPKPFAIGVRVEHPQILIDQAQYKCPVKDTHLPPASYSLVEQVNGKGVFSFCMCPGGIIATASTAPGELVVNGWSPSKRNNPFANSGIVVAMEMADLKNLGRFDDQFTKDAILSSPLCMLNLQKSVEEKAFQMGGGKFVAPAQRMVDFVQKKISRDLPDCSYLPGINSADLYQIFPEEVSSRLAKAFAAFGKKIKHYYTNEAVLVATESRTSSPVTIPRHPVLLSHPQLDNLYPCGEGAGYAGGIVSAAMDGEKCALQISMVLQ